MALLALHGAVVLFGFAGLFGKWLVWSPAAIVLGRTSIAALALAAVVLYRQRTLPPPTVLAAGNGLLLAAHWVAFFAAIQASTVATGLLGFASFPLFVPLLDRVLHGVPAPRGVWKQAVLVVAGLVLLVPDLRWQGQVAQLQGLGWGVVAGFTFAWLTVRTRAAGATHRPEVMALWQNAVAALCVAPIVLWQGGVGAAITPLTLLQIVLLGIGCTALAHTLFIGGLRRVGAATASVIAALEPVYGIALAAWLLGEIPAGRTLAGAALLMAAALAASRRARFAAAL